MATATPSNTIATAIDQVLEAERQVAVAIAAAQAAAQASIDAAREGRRDLLERARRRVIRVREIAQADLARQVAQLDAADQSQVPANPDIDTARAALVRLATQLTTASGD